MNLVDALHRLTKMWGANFFGIADLSPAREAIANQGGARLADYPYAVSMGITLSHRIVDQLPHAQERTVAVSYRHEYDTVNQRLDMLASHISGFLQENGHQTFPVPASRRIDDQKLCSVFSHKLAAHLAGLGWIGKNSMVITPTQGPRVRWVSVLTDAPLPMSGKSMEDQCGSCQACVDICPMHAFNGRPFHPDEPREKRYDADKCNEYYNRMKIKKPGLHVCGLCLYVCPYGKH